MTDRDCLWASEKLLATMICGSRRVAPDIASEVRPEWFTDEAKRKVFVTAQSLALKGHAVDPVSVLDALKVTEGPLYEAVWGLTDMLALDLGWEAEAKILHDAHKLRELRAEAKKFAEFTFGASAFDREELAALAERLAKIASDDIGDAAIQNLDDLINANRKEFKAAWDGDSPAVVKTGIPLFDSQLPVVATLVHVVAARPSQGKTALMVAMAKGIAEADETAAVLVVSVEELAADISRRMWAHESRVDSRIFTDPKGFSGSAHEALGQLAAGARGVQRLSKRVGIWTVRGATWQKICRVARRYHRQVTARGWTLRAVVIDYVQKVQDENRRTDRIERIENAMNGFEVLAGETGAAVIVGSQLNRDAAKSLDKQGIPVPAPEHAFGGDSIFHTAAWMMMLVHPSQHEQSDEESPDPSKPARGSFDEHELYVYVGKNRRGKHKGRRFSLHVDFSTGRFSQWRRD